MEIRSFRVGSESSAEGVATPFRYGLGARNKSAKYDIEIGVSAFEGKANINPARQDCAVWPTADKPKRSFVSFYYDITLLEEWSTLWRVKGPFDFDYARSVLQYGYLHHGALLTK